MKMGINRGHAKSCSAGFTLIELAVVLVIIAILIYIALPRFIPHTKTKAAEAKTNLGAIYNAQTKYHEQYGTYAGGPICFKLLGWAPEGDTIYTYYCGEDIIAPTKPNIPVSVCNNVQPASSPKAFTVCASANVDRDATIDTWSMRDNKELRNDNNDVAD
jgi:prepilin-type N-terminal cleavage/methylation domain-containing protein